MNLIHDDCMNILPKYEDNYFDLAIVDPPYGKKPMRNDNGTWGTPNTRKFNSNDDKWDIKPNKKYFDELFRVSKNQIIQNVDVWLGNKPTVNLIAQKDVISTLSFDQIKSIKSIIQYEKPVSSPFKAGDKLGSLTINISGKTPIIVPLVADKDIKNVNPFMKILAAIKYLMFGTSLDGI